MQINISTRHGHLSAQTQEKLADRLHKLDRYNERITAMQVTVDLEVENTPDVEVQLSIERTGAIIARDRGDNLWAVVDHVIHKLETQLRRHKEKHKDHRVIVATHAYLRRGGRDDRFEKDYKLEGNSGQGIWDKLVRKHKNIFMVVCGHVIGTRNQVTINNFGRPVHEILVDYQGLENGGNGWLRTMRFSPRENKIHLETYSPLLEKFNRGAEHEFSLDYEMKKARKKKAG